MRTRSFAALAIAIFQAAGSGASAAAGEPNLQDLQKRLDAAQRQKAASAAASASSGAPVAARAIVIVRSDAPCELTMDGRNLGVLPPDAPKSFSTTMEEISIRCQATEASATYSSKIAIQPGVRHMIQIELRDRVLALRRDRSDPTAGLERREPSAGAANSASSVPSKLLPPDTPPSRAPVTSTSKEVAAASLASGTLGTRTIDGRSLGRVFVKDAYTRTPQELELRLTANDIAKSVYSSGDAISSDGTVLAVRIGNDVATAKSGALWKFPLRAGDRGQATLTMEGQPRDVDVSWHVDESSIGFNLEMFMSWRGPGQVNQWITYTGTWTAYFSGPDLFPTTSKLVLRAGGQAPILITTSWQKP